MKKPAPSGLDPLPRIAVCYASVLTLGSGVKFRTVIGHENRRYVGSVLRRIGRGPFTVSGPLEGCRLSVRGTSAEESVPVHLLLPVAVAHKTDVALSRTRFSLEDDLLEASANRLLTEWKICEAARRLLQALPPGEVAVGLRNAEARSAALKCELVIPEVPNEHVHPVVRRIVNKANDLRRST